METLERDKLKGMALLKYMIENKKKMEEEAVEEYKNSKSMHEAFDRLSIRRKEKLKNQILQK
jgi:hypothetical protein